MTSPAETAGLMGENDVAGAVQLRIDRGWPIIARRVRAIPGYRRLFTGA